MVICASTESSAFLIARKMLNIYKTASLTSSRSPSTILTSTNACKRKKSGLQKQSRSFTIISAKIHAITSKTKMRLDNNNIFITYKGQHTSFHFEKLQGSYYSEQAHESSTLKYMQGNQWLLLEKQKFVVCKLLYCNP